MHNQLARLFVCLTACAAASPAFCQDIEQAKIVFFPGHVAATETEFAEGDVLLEMPLHWDVSVRLGQDITLQKGRSEFVLREGALLPRIFEGSGQGRKSAFCTRSRVIEKRVGVHGITAFVDRLQDSLNDGQICLADADNDGAFDHAFALGLGEDRSDLGEIAPVAYEELRFEPIDMDRDKVRLVFHDINSDRIKLRLDIMQMGEAREFDSFFNRPISAARISSLYYGANSPTAWPIAGIQFAVVSGDRRAKRARFSWHTTIEPEFEAVIPLELHYYQMR